MRFPQCALFILFVGLSCQLPGRAFGQVDNVDIPAPPVSIYWEDLQRDMSKLNAVDHGLMGESIDLHTGEVSFSHTDVSIPGNFELEVALRRKIVPGLENHNATPQEFGDWTLDVPYMEILSMALGGENTYGATRCSNPTEAMPAIIGQGLHAWPVEYSEGLKLNIPGRGKQLVVRKRTDKTLPVPSSAEYVTNDHWYLECAPGVNGSANEGFIAYAPNGDKYIFSHWFEQDYYNIHGETTSVVIIPPQNVTGEEVIRSLTGIRGVDADAADAAGCNDPNASDPMGNCFFGSSSGGGGRHSYVIHSVDAEILPEVYGGLPGGQTFSRIRNVLRATRVEDVFGNWVDFDYNADGQLTKISSSDQREIALQYSRDDDLISSVVANNRTWSYDYSPRNLSENALLASFHLAYSSQEGPLTLSDVSLPDDTAWRFDLDGLVARGTISTACETNDQSLSVTHPNGTTGVFTISERNHRIGVAKNHLHWWKNCFPIVPKVRQSHTREEFMQYTARSTSNTMSVIEKTISGPGVELARWIYEYEDDDNPGRDDNNEILINTPDDPTNWTKVTDPLGVETTYFHNWSLSAQGGVLRNLEIRNSGGELVSATDYEYETSAFYGGTSYLPSNSLIRQEEYRSIRIDPLGEPLQVPAVSPEDYSTIPRSQTSVYSTKLIQIEQNGDSFSTAVEYNTDPSLTNFSFGKPVRIEKGFDGNETPNRIQEITYEHKLDKWIVGLPETITLQGRERDRVEYDAFGRVESLFKYGSFWESFDYFSDGTLQSHTNASSHMATFSDYHRGKAQFITRYDDTEISREIDDNGWVLSETSARDYTTTYEYNDLGWLEKVIPPAAVRESGEAVETNIVYDYSPGGGGAIKQVSANGALKTTRLMDGFYRIMSESREDVNDPDIASVQSFKYDIESRRVFESLPFSPLSDGSWPSSLPGVETEYDALGRVSESRQTMAPFAETKYRYLEGNRIEVTDPRSNISTTTFQTFGAPVSAFPEQGDTSILPITVDTPLGANQVLEYDLWGNMRFDRQVIGSTVLAETEFSYNNRNFLAWSEDAAGDRSSVHYDELDREIVAYDGENRASRTVYDEMGRVDKLIQGWAGSASGQGELDCTTMRNSYNPGAGYLQQCYQAFTYDANGNIDSVSDARGNNTEYTYDALDRAKRATYPDGSYTEVQKYDVFGNPLTQRTRVGDIHTSIFDALGRMRSMSTPDRNVVYNYDAADRRTCGAVMGAGALDLNASPNCEAATQNLQNRIVAEYDAAGRLETDSVEIAGQGILSTSYAFDKNNNRTGINWHGDVYSVDYIYDANNRLETVQENASVLLGHYDYDAQSRLRAIHYGGENYATGSAVSQTVFDWEVDSDLEALSHNFFVSEDVSFSYNHDASAKMISEGATSTDWMYLPTETRTDAYGIANNLNQYSDVNGIAVSYDLNGNRTAFDGLETPHDSENRLEGIGDAASYMYDAGGRRIAKTVGGEMTRYLHAGDMEIGEYQGGALQHIYVPGHSVDQRVAWHDVVGSETYYFHANLQGSVQAVVDSSGAVTDQYVYTPFGVQAPLVSTGNPFRYTGRRYDPESGLYYYRARYYDAVHGRFLEADPVGYDDQMNLYTYVANDPLNLTDPTGMEIGEHESLRGAAEAAASKARFTDVWLETEAQRSARVSSLKGEFVQEVMGSLNRQRFVGSHVDLSKWGINYDYNVNLGGVTEAWIKIGIGDGLDSIYPTPQPHSLGFAPGTSPQEPAPHVAWNKPGYAIMWGGGDPAVGLRGMTAHYSTNYYYLSGEFSAAAEVLANDLQGHANSFGVPIVFQAINTSGSSDSDKLYTITPE